MVSMAQPSGLVFTQDEMEEVIKHPAQVDQLIADYQREVDRTTDLGTKIAYLQTIILLEPHSNNAYCVLLRPYERISNLFMSIGLKDDALGIVHRTLAIWRLCEDRDPVILTTETGKLGSFHLITGSKDSALFYFRRAAAFSDSITDPIWHSSALNNMGIVWDSLGNTDSSYAYYNEAIFGLNPDDDEHRHLLGSITDNLANWYLREEDGHVADQLFTDNISRYRTFGDTSHLVKSYIGKAKALWKLNEHEKMLMVLDTAQNLLSKKTEDDLKTMEQQMKIHSILRSYYTMKGDLKQELKVADDLMYWHMAHSMKKNETQRLMIASLNRSELARIHRELELRSSLTKANLQVKQMYYWTLAMIIITVISIVSVIFFATRKK
jgi:tetratricopeptide (TPR) repeat protein